MSFYNNIINYAAWNEQPLDTYNDISINFEYSRYSDRGLPGGGFLVGFITSDQASPKEGGPGYSLGYLPSTQTETCRLKGYNGLAGSFLGIGFDITGLFGKKSELNDGLDVPSFNSITIRSGIGENFKYLYNSGDIRDVPGLSSYYIGDYLKSNYFGMSGFVYDESDLDINYPSEKETLAKIPDILKKFNKVKIMITEAFTRVEVFIKPQGYNDYIQALDYRLPLKKRTAVKTVLTHTDPENNVGFEIKNFNVAGFPGTPSENLVDSCKQKESYNTYFTTDKVVTGKDYIAINPGNKILVYKLLDGKYKIVQTISSSSGLQLLGGNSDFLITRPIESEDNTVVLYYNRNDVFVRSANVSVPGGYNITSADIDSSTLVLGSPDGGGYLLIYQYKLTPQFTSFNAVWELANTLFLGTSAFIGNSVEVDSGIMVAGSDLNSVHTFTKNRLGVFEYVNTLTSPTSTFNNKFGYSISLEKGSLLVGAPNERRREGDIVGMGEVYYYRYNTNKKSWTLLMKLGDFYNLNTVGGNFGYSLSLKNNIAVVGSPFEMYHYPSFLTIEDNPNVGRAYIFEKTDYGLFSLSTMIAPSSADFGKYQFYARGVGILNSTGVILSPFLSDRKKAYADFIETSCLFNEPPPHLEVPVNAIALSDNSGYNIDINNTTYTVIGSY